MLTRTQIMLDGQTKEDLEDLAALSGESMSKIVREVLSKELPKRKVKINKNKNVVGVSALLKWAKGAAGGPKHVDIDKVLYSDPHEKRSK